MRIRAYNIIGWSSWSSILIIQSTGIPMKPQPPAIEIQSGQVIVTWNDPFANYQAIDSYRIVFNRIDIIGDYTEIVQYCSGLSQAIINAKSCSVPLEVFRQAPFNLVAGNVVKA